MRYLIEMKELFFIKNTTPVHVARILINQSVSIINAAEMRAR